MSISPENAPNREKVKLLLVGSPAGVNSIILHLYKLGFAAVGEWSPPQPTNNQGEVMRILIKIRNRVYTDKTRLRGFNIYWELTI
ncbi:MAG TPA: hypothetical protein VK203_26515 [Nostocaceae cyanobacterium]|nr:hypothetical protein [Nostocaceae cyanobacterium]